MTRRSMVIAETTDTLIMQEKQHTILLSPAALEFTRFAVPLVLPVLCALSRSPRSPAMRFYKKSCRPFQPLFKGTKDG